MATSHGSTLGLAQKDGNVVSISGLNVLAYIASYEERLVEEDSFILGVGVGSCSLGMQMVYPHVPEFTGVASAAKCVNQHPWGCRNAAEVNVVSGFYDLDGLVRAYEMDVFVHMVECL